MEKAWEPLRAAWELLQPASLGTARVLLGALWDPLGWPGIRWGWPGNYWKRANISVYIKFVNAKEDMT